MADYVALTTVDWETLTGLRSASSSDPSFRFLPDAVARLRPFVDDDDRVRLAAAEQVRAPNGLRITLGLRVEPARFVDEAVTWLRAAPPRVRDDVLASLARTGPWYSMSIERSMFLGFYSEAYRIIVVGLAPDALQDDSRFDGDPAILRATGGRLYPDPASTVIYSDKDVKDIAAALRRIDVTTYPKGDMALLFDHYDDFSSSGQPLESACRDDVEQLRALYDTAAGNGWGVKLLT